MKVKVLKTFTDKNNRNIIYKKATNIEVTKERFEEINSTKNGILVEEVKKATKKK